MSTSKPTVDEKKDDEAPEVQRRLLDFIGNDREVHARRDDEPSTEAVALHALEQHGGRLHRVQRRSESAFAAEVGRIVGILHVGIFTLRAFRGYL